jgi:hypothetical protein
MTATISFNPNRALTANVTAAAGARVFFYDSGTTNLKTVYADNGRTIPHPSPLLADSAGIFPQVFGPQGEPIKAVVQTSAGATLYTLDPVSASDLAASAFFADFAEMMANKAAWPVGQVLNTRIGAFAYKVAPAAATDHHITRPDGLKLYVQRSIGVYPLDAFGNPALPATWLAALAAANGDPVALCSDHTLTGAVNWAGPVTIYGNGHTVNMGTAGALNFTATLESLPNLASNIALHANTVTFAAAHGLVEGDVFCVWDGRDYSWSSHRAEYHDGDWMRVAEVVSATQVRIYGHAPDAYAAANMTCHKITGQGVDVSNLRMIPRASADFFLVQYHQGVRLHGIVCPAGNSNRNIYVSRSYDVVINDVRSTVLQGNAYPVVIGNCKKVRVSGSAMFSDRHVLGLGGGDGPGSVPTRDVIVSGMLMTNLDTGIGAADSHGNVDDITFANCIIDSAANLGGRNVRAIGCKIVGRSAFADGNGIFSGEIVGGLYHISNCEIETIGDGQSFGIIHFTPYWVDGTEIKELREAWTLRVDNLVIRNRGTNSATMQCIIVNVGSSGVSFVNSRPIEIVINGLEVDSPSMNTIVRISGTKDHSANLSIAISDNLIAPSGALVVCGNAANNNCRMRLPRQTVTEEITYATTQSVVVGNARNFRWSYPVRPWVSISASKMDGSVYNPGTSNIAIPYAYDSEAASLRMAIKSSTGANFSVGDTVTMIGQAWVDTL